MKEILFFIFDNMTDYEITFTMHMLNTSNKFKVITISYDRCDVQGRSGAIYKPHRLVTDNNNFNAYGLVICGGWYGDYRAELEELIYYLNDKERLIAGICGAGTYMLAKSSVLENVKYTTPITEWTYEHEKVFGKDDIFPRENYINQNVVQNKNIITSLGHTFIDFAAEIMEWFKMFENSSEKIEFIKYMKSK